MAMTQSKLDDAKVRLIGTMTLWYSV